MSTSSKKVTKTISLVVFVNQLIGGWKGEGEFAYTVIRFVSTSTNAIVSDYTTLVEIKYVDARGNVHILALTSVPLTITMVQVPNLALTHTHRITVCGWSICYVVTGGGYRGNFSSILYGIAISREAASLPSLFIHYIFQPLVLCKRKN
jgi:hypothetical protein